MKKIKNLIWQLISKFGHRIRDERTGDWLGRAIVWRSFATVWLIGLHRPYVRPLFRSESRLIYARHRLGFATHKPVDYASLRAPKQIDHTSKTLWAILCHQSPKECERVLLHWSKLGYPLENILVVHGGTKDDYTHLAHQNKVFVDDQNLRTKRHPVEKQSYAGPLREISHWLTERPAFNFVCFLEYDHLPVIKDWDVRLTKRLSEESADVLFHHLSRVDGTNAPHYLYHLSDSSFEDTWESISQREDCRVILNCLATGSFWKREALIAVAGTPERHPIYLEMYLPTLAHHLGFRVRDLGQQNDFAEVDPLTSAQIKTALCTGAWSLHPIKDPSAIPLLQ